MDTEKPTKFDPKSRHYDAGGIEVQEIIKAKLTPEQYRGWCLGNIIKYSCRANFKHDFARDIEKVGFYQRFLDNATEEALDRITDKEINDFNFNIKQALAEARMNQP